MDFPDVNVLVYAFRPDSPHHTASKGWLETAVHGNARFGISPLALSAVVRITTNPRAFPQASSLDDALGYCEDILGQPHCSVIEPGERHWRVFRELCGNTGTRGPRVSDVWTAALAIEHGCTLISFDRDYARFPGLHWREPTA